MSPQLREHIDRRALQAQAGGAIGGGGRSGGLEAAGGDERRSGDRRNPVDLDRRLENNDRRIDNNDRRQRVEEFPGEDRRQGDRREPDQDRRELGDRREPGSDRRRIDPQDGAGSETGGRNDEDRVGDGAEARGTGREPSAGATSGWDGPDTAELGRGRPQPGESERPTRTSVSEPAKAENPSAHHAGPNSESGHPSTGNESADPQGPLIDGPAPRAPLDELGQSQLVTHERSDAALENLGDFTELGLKGAELLTGQELNGVDSFTLNSVGSNLRAWIEMKSAENGTLPDMPKPRDDVEMVEQDDRGQDEVSPEMDQDGSGAGRDESAGVTDGDAPTDVVGDRDGSERFNAGRPDGDAGTEPPR